MKRFMVALLVFSVFYFFLISNERSVYVANKNINGICSKASINQGKVSFLSSLTQSELERLKMKDISSSKSIFQADQYSYKMGIIISSVSICTLIVERDVIIEKKYVEATAGG
jgi:hypothetical protein